MFPYLIGYLEMSLFGKKSAIGLDIGSGFVKIVEVDRSGGQPEVSRVAMRPLLPDAIVEGEVMDPGLVADTIKGLFREAGITDKDVITAVGGHDVIIKKIEMDRMKESDAREVIRWEAEQHVPFDIKSVELDFQILNPLEEGLQMEVLLVAAKRELVDNKVSLLSDAGLSPSVIDVDAFALHNAFEHNYPKAMFGIVALVNVGHEATNVNILEDGVPILTRDIPFGSRRVREDLQRERGLTAEQAEEVVQGHNHLPDLMKFVEQSAVEVAVGIERASAFLMTQQSGEGLGKIFLSGGGARIPGMAQALGNRMNVETHLVNPFERIPVRPDAPGNLNLEEASPMLLLPLGLALRA
jgi:type IV pilus assembly protein PilM